SRPLPVELWVVGGLTLLAALPSGRAAVGPLRWAVPAGLVLVLAASALLESRRTWFSFTDGEALLRQDAGVFAILQDRMTLQDRFYAVASNARYGLTEKNASRFDLRSISDYDPQTSRRFADLNVLMRTNKPMQSINDFNLKFTRAPRNRRILNLLATRY